MANYPDIKDPYKLPECLILPVGKIDRSARDWLKNEEPEEKCVGYYPNIRTKKLVHVTQCIIENSIVQCSPGFLTLQDKYYIVGNEFQNMISHLENEMSDFYESEEKTKPRQIDARMPKKEEVKIGFVFAVRENNTWYRCEVVKILEQGEYEVFLLENGITLTVTLPRLRYLHMNFVLFPVQAIAIKIRNKDIDAKINWDELDMTRDSWIREMFTEVIGNNLLLVHFKKREPGGKCGSVWNADVSVINQIDQEIIWKDAFLELKNRIQLFNGHGEKKTAGEGQNTVT